MKPQVNCLLCCRVDRTMRMVADCFTLGPLGLFARICVTNSPLGVGECLRAWPHIVVKRRLGGKPWRFHHKLSPLSALTLRVLCAMTGFGTSESTGKEKRNAWNMRCAHCRGCVIGD